MKQYEMKNNEEKINNKNRIPRNEKQTAVKIGPIESDSIGE